MAITVHIHDRHGHRVIDQGPSAAPAPAPARQPSQGTPPARQPGMTHELAAQHHEQAAQHHVGMNYGAQNPVSRAHTEASKAHKTAHSLLGKPGYQQAAHWAQSATAHAHRLAPPQQAKDYGTAEGARHRQEGGGYSSASTRPQPTPGYGSSPHQQQTRQAGRLAHLQQQASHPLFGSQHQPEIRRLQQQQQQRGHDASPRAPGTPKPPPPVKPKAPPPPKPPASAAPPKPPQPKLPGATQPKPAVKLATPPKAKAKLAAPPKPKAPPKPQASPGGHVARATEAVASAAEVPHGIVAGLGAIQKWGENLRSRDKGTWLGGRRGHATRRHLKAEDETKRRRNWFPGQRSIDAWFYRDFDESKINRGGDPKNTGRFSKGSGSKAAPATSPKEGEGKSETKPKADKEKSPAAYLFQQQGDIPDPKGNPKDPAYQAAAKDYMDKFYVQRSADDRRAIEDAKAENDAMEETYKTFQDEKGKYTDERQREHDRILFSGPKALFPEEAVAKARPPEGEHPTFYMIGGRGGSGKSWFTQEAKGDVQEGRLAKAKREGAILIDSDAIKAALPGYQPHLAGRYHEEASFLVDRAVNYARANGLNVILDATMKTFSKKTSDKTAAGEACEPPSPDCEPIDGGALEKLKLFKGNSSTPMGGGLAKGRHSYRVEGHYMFAPMDVAMNNVVDRFKGRNGDFDGRFVPPEYVLSSTTNEETFDKLREFLDDWSLYDNSGMAQRKTEGYRIPPKLVAERGKQAEA